jgi:hypothetical protein
MPVESATQRSTLAGEGEEAATAANALRAGGWLMPKAWQAALIVKRPAST